MKKIGLMTFSSNMNYGSWCLTYALFLAISKLGYNIEIMDYHYSECEDQERITLKKIVHVIKKWDGSREEFDDLVTKINVQKGFDKDRKKYWKVSSHKYDPSNIYKANEEYDIFLIGSDQVWDHRFGGASNNFFLDFVNEDKVKVAFSASSGYTILTFDDSRKEEFERYLSSFRYIAVREPNLKSMIKECLNRDVDLVCDPTMLLENGIWKSFVHENLEKRPYILITITDSYKMFDVARHYAKKHGCDILYVGYGKPIKNIRNVNPKTISDWITLFYYAEKVFTGSYHGLLFSIYLEKEFGFFYRRPLVRFSFLAEKLKLDQYEIHHCDYDVERRIDWEKIKAAEEEFRTYSWKKLEEMLQIAVE